MREDPVLLKLLEQVADLPFSLPVTAFLTDAIVRGSSCYGVTYRHVRAEANGRFANGHFIHTSAIVEVEQEGPFWVLRTVSGSFYVILSFNPFDGAQSLEEYRLRRVTSGHPEPWRLH